MQNVLSLTEFVRSLVGRPMGFSAVYLVPKGKAYRNACKALVAVSIREDLKLSTTQLLITDPATLTTIEAIKVTVK